MAGEPLGRRAFLGAGGAFICTIGGVHVATDGGEADIRSVAAAAPAPVVEAAAAGAAPAPTPDPLPGPGGEVREYWLRAERARLEIVPTGRDEMMGTRVPGKTGFTAFVYRAYTANWAKPIGHLRMPGPTLEARTGDVLVVHLQNHLPVPITLHPHGLYYTPAMDGAYKGRSSSPGSYVRPGEEFRYVWEARAGTEGAWPYHDHGPVDPLGVYKGLFGLIIVRGRDEPVPDAEHILFFHSLAPLTTGLDSIYSCINGRAFAGNTPTLHAKVGQRVVQHVIGIDSDFHTYHLHGHRWTDAANTVVDNVTFGPGDVRTISFVEDNPGRWFYHCHVFTHLHLGMNGWYVVDP